MSQSQMTRVDSGLEFVSMTLEREAAEREFAARSTSLTTDTVRPQRRWSSRRALLLHVEVVVVASACVAAGWWQATRALAGNGLSWFYSIEWPAFAVVAVVGWWILIHEDPEAYRARKRRRQDGGQEAIEGAASGIADRGTATAGVNVEVTVQSAIARMATRLVVVVGVEFSLGIATLILVPLGRPSGWQPSTGVPIYLAHGVVGLFLTVGAVIFLSRTRQSARISRLSGLLGAIGVAAAGVGGLLTLSHPGRLAGMALMLLGPLLAAFGYSFPMLEKLGG